MSLGVDSSLITTSATTDLKKEKKSSAHTEDFHYLPAPPSDSSLIAKGQGHPATTPCDITNPAWCGAAQSCFSGTLWMQLPRHKLPGACELLSCAPFVHYERLNPLEERVAIIQTAASKGSIWEISLHTSVGLKGLKQSYTWLLYATIFDFALMDQPAAVKVRGAVGKQLRWF